MWLRFAMLILISSCAWQLAEATDDPELRSRGTCMVSLRVAQVSAPIHIWRAKSTLT